MIQSSVAICEGSGCWRSRAPRPDGRRGGRRPREDGAGHGVRLGCGGMRAAGARVALDGRSVRVQRHRPACRERGRRRVRRGRRERPRGMEGRPAPRADRRLVPWPPRRGGAGPAAPDVGAGRAHAPRGAWLAGDPSAMHRVFAYGTLLAPSRQKRLFGRRIPLAPAVLTGWRKVRCVGRYPGIVRDPNSRTEGGVLLLTRAELAAADDWEGVPDLYRRRRIRVTSGGRSRACWAYVPVPGPARAPSELLGRVRHRGGDLL